MHTVIIGQARLSEVSAETRDALKTDILKALNAAGASLTATLAIPFSFLYEDEFIGALHCAWPAPYLIARLSDLLRPYPVSFGVGIGDDEVHAYPKPEILIDLPGYELARAAAQAAARDWAGGAFGVRIATGGADEVLLNALCMAADGLSSRWDAQTAKAVRLLLRKHESVETASAMLGEDPKSLYERLRVAGYSEYSETLSAMTDYLLSAYDLAGSDPIGWRTQANLARYLEEAASDWDGAANAYRMAIRLQEAENGEEDEDGQDQGAGARLYARLAYCCAMSGDIASSAPYLERAVAMAGREANASPFLTQLGILSARMFLMQGDYEAASDAVNWAQSQAGENDAPVASSICLISASVCFALGDYSQAFAYAQAALEAAGLAFGESSENAGDACYLAAQIAFASADYDKAVSLADSAIGAYLDSMGSDAEKTRRAASLSQEAGAAMGAR